MIVTFRLVLTGVRAAHIVTGMPTSGADLRAERARARITTTDLAVRMGVSRQTLWVIERSGVVPAERAAEYRRALRDVMTAEGAA